MLSSDSQSSSPKVSLEIVLVGFQYAELSHDCRTVLTSLQPSPKVKWVNTAQEAVVDCLSGNLPDVMIVDCRQDGRAWKEISQRQLNSLKTMIIGVMNVEESRPNQSKMLEDGVGCRVDETIVPVILKWGCNLAQERQQFIVEQEQLRMQLGETEYKIEMANVASTVLHNVGNVLTSVMVAANMVESLVAQSSVTLVNRVAELLATHREDLGTYLTEDPKGKRIPPSLEKLGDHLIEEQQTVLKEMKGVVRNIRHMRQVILSHQAMAKSVGETEQIALVDILSHAMELSFQPEDSNWMTICGDYEEVPAVWADQHQLLQILVNLLRNAKQAMLQHIQENHVLNLSVKYQSDGQESVVLRIRDSGIGIAPEHISKLFMRGFTTKKDGNGIGLHSSIAAIQDMGGTMHVHSEGVGKGATFELTFPVQKEAMLS